MIARPMFQALIYFAIVGIGCDHASGQWAMIDLSPYTNARIQGYQPEASAFPEGLVVLGEVPFNIQTVGGDNAWNAEMVPGPYPHVLNVPIGVHGAAEVHTLINTYYGQPGPTSYIKLEFFGSNGAYHSKELTGNVDVRDHLESNWTNSINGTTTTNVFSTGGGKYHDNRLDKQKITLPPVFGNEVLMSMRLTSTGGVLVSDASIQGLTINTCPTLTCGQKNSPCATMTVNGAGAVGHGPFNVTVPPGGTLSLAWSGPADQPLLLLGASNLVPGQSLGGSLIVDLDVASIAFLFSGYDPFWGALFFTDHSGGGYGQATQAFSVPPSVSGAVVNVQGVVFDTAFTCSGGIGYMTTASFSIQL